MIPSTNRVRGLLGDSPAGGYPARAASPQENPLKRISILLIALLALVVSACAGDQGSSAPASEPTATEEPTPEPTEAPESDDPGSSEDAGGGTALNDLLPDELSGMARISMPELEAMIAPMLAQSGVDAAEAEFTFASYGEGEDAVQVQAFRIPGMSELQLQTLARAMSGGLEGGGAAAETVDVGGKTVLQITGPQVPGGAYIYFADGAMFTVVSPSADVAAQLLAELP